MMRKTYGIVSKRVMVVLASITLLLSLTMCETDYCNENMFVTGTLKVFFKQSKGSIGVIVAPMDEGVEEPRGFKGMYSGVPANFLLNPASDTSEYYIFTQDSVPLRKIAIVHSNKNVFVNAECGMRSVSTIDTVLIIKDGVEGDSISILMRDVDENYENENIEIYLAGFE